MSSHRHERPLKALSLLEREWEARLRREGLGERSLFDYSPSDQIRFVSTDAIEKALNTGTRPGGDSADAESLSIALNGGQVVWHDHPTAQLFRALSAAVARLPARWPVKSAAFLATYADTGNLRQSAISVGVSVRQAGRYLAAFNAYAVTAKVTQFPRPFATRRKESPQPAPVQAPGPVIQLVKNGVRV